MMQHAVAVTLEPGPESDRYHQSPPGHNGRIQYANPENLPSYPSTGLKTNGAAAGAAASLGWANQKSFEHWKPTNSASAGAAASLGWANQKSFEHWKPTSSTSAQTAATLAKDYKMPAIHQTERSSDSQRAATLAAGASQRRPRDSPVSPPSTWGNTAANMAFNASNTSSPPPRDQGGNSLARRQSLRAANGAVDGARPRATSTPQKYTYPDQENATANALNAASVAHRQPSARFPEGGAVPYTNMSREMFTSRPPVKPEVDEKRHNDILHASAVAMAKQMYTRQQNLIDEAKRKNTDAGTAAARSSSFSRHGVESPASDGPQADMRFPNLQEAAYRLAQERLAKLHDQHQKDREYQEYYGAGTQAQGGRLGSIRGKLTRRRSSSDGDLIVDRRLSQQSSHLPKVDEDKRARDRQALLAAAQRNVKAQMDGMDRKMYQDTGRIQPVKMSEWESKAHSAALLRSESRKDANAGKVDLGAGKFMDQDEINAIAARNIQPMLDDITQKAEAERERQATMKMEEERRKETAEREKVREHEVQDIHKKLKEQQKEAERHRKAEAKEAEKARKEQEKEEKRRAKEEKRKSKGSPKPIPVDFAEQAKADKEMAPITPIPPVIVPVTEQTVTATDQTETATADGTTTSPVDNHPKEESPHNSKEAKKPLALMLKKRAVKEDHEQGQEAHGNVDSANNQPKQRSQSFSRRGDDSTAVGDEPRSPTHKVKTWFKSHFSTRPHTKSSTSETSPTATEEQGSGSGAGSITAGEGERGFIGGAALRGHSRGQSNASTDSSLRDVAFANVSRDTRRQQLSLPATVATPAVETPATETAMSEAPIIPSPMTETAPVIPSPMTETAASATPTTQQPEVPLALRDVETRSISSVSSLSSSPLSEELEEDDDESIRFEDASPFTRAEMARPLSSLAPLVAKDAAEAARPPTPPAPLVPKDSATMARLSASPVRESRFAEIID